MEKTEQIIKNFRRDIEKDGHSKDDIESAYETTIKKYKAKYPDIKGMFDRVFKEMDEETRATLRKHGVKIESKDSLLNYLNEILEEEKNLLEHKLSKELKSDIEFSIKQTKSAFDEYLAKDKLHFLIAASMHAKDILTYLERAAKEHSKLDKRNSFDPNKNPEGRLPKYKKGLSKRSKDFEKKSTFGGSITSPFKGNN